MTKINGTLLIVSDNKDLPRNASVGQLALIKNENNVYFKGEFGWFQLTKKAITKNPAEEISKHKWNTIEEYLNEKVLKEKEGDLCCDYKVKSTDECVKSYINAVHQTDASKPDALRLIDACSIEERNHISNRIDGGLFKNIKDILDSEEDVKAVDSIKDKYVENLINRSRDKDLKKRNEIREDINRSIKLNKTLHKVKKELKKYHYDEYVSLSSIEPKLFIDKFNNIERKKKKKHWYKNKKQYASTNKKTSK